MCNISTWASAIVEEEEDFYKVWPACAAGIVLMTHQGISHHALCYALLMPLLNTVHIASQYLRPFEAECVMDLTGHYKTASSAVSYIVH